MAAMQKFFSKKLCSFWRGHKNQIGFIKSVRGFFSSSSQPSYYTIERTKEIKNNYASFRYMSQLSASSNSRNEFDDFMAVLPSIVEELTVPGRYVESREACEWLSQVLSYNLQGGKKLRGLITVSSYKLLEKSENLNAENINLARILGWCVEMFQSYFLIIDDLMDNSESRRGVPCWHKRPEVGLSAANDACMILVSIGTILKKYFSNHHGYRNILETINMMVLMTTVGQYLDMSTSTGDKPNLKKFTMEKYNSIVKHKTAYYSCQMPVTLSLYLARMDHPETHRQANRILLKMGLLFQIQDDFMDCFGDSSVTGKIGNDIQEGKCSWLAVVALQRTSPAQKQIMEELYGSKDPSHVETIKNLYEALGLKEVYIAHEKQLYDLIKKEVLQVTCGIPHELFLNMADKLYGRMH